MKDYAEEELGVTGGEWKIIEQGRDCYYVVGKNGQDEELPFRGDWEEGEEPLKRFWANARITTASKDLYNVLRAIIDDGARMSDYGHHWVEVDTAVFDEAEALLARLREATK